jgi:hypothetical protein
MASKEKYQKVSQMLYKPKLPTCIILVFKSIMVFLNIQSGHQAALLALIKQWSKPDERVPEPVLTICNKCLTLTHKAKCAFPTFNMAAT